MARQRLSPILLAAMLVLIPCSLAASAAAAQRPTSESEVNEAEIDAAKVVQAKHETSLLKQAGVQGVGVGLMEDGKRVGIHVFVKKGQRGPELPAQLENVPVRIIEAGPFRSHDGPCDSGPPCHFEALALPVQMGNSTSNVNGEFAGTLGFRAVRRGDSSVVGYIVPNHVAAASVTNLCPAQINPADLTANLTAFATKQCQPGTLDAEGTCIPPTIGNLIQVVPLVMGEEFVNTVDAAFVQSNRGCVSKTIRDIGNPTGTAAFPKLNSTLQLSGRTSGLRKVKVVAVNFTGSVDYDTCGAALFVSQAITAPVTGSAASLPGDSGAPVVTSTRQPVGLNFAGDDFFGIITPMPLVLDALGLVIDTASNAPAAGSCP